MLRALFLDRDGVLNVDHGYVYRTKDFQVIDGVFEALRQAQALDYAPVVVTNQSGIGRGYFTLTEYRALEAHMLKLFAEQGVDFAGIYYCPHHPEGVVPELKFECDCRKPKPGMILRAARELDIDLARSVLIGDKESDVAAASAAGIGRAIRIKNPAQTLLNIVNNL